MFFVYAACSANLCLLFGTGRASKIRSSRTFASSKLGGTFMSESISSVLSNITTFTTFPGKHTLKTQWCNSLEFFLLPKGVKKSNADPLEIQIQTLSGNLRFQIHVRRPSLGQNILSFVWWSTIIFRTLFTAFCLTMFLPPDFSLRNESNCTLYFSL